MYDIHATDRQTPHEILKKVVVLDSSYEFGRRITYEDSRKFGEHSRPPVMFVRMWYEYLQGMGDNERSVRIFVKSSYDDNV